MFQLNHAVAIYPKGVTESIIIIHSFIHSTSQPFIGLFVWQRSPCIARSHTGFNKMVARSMANKSLFLWPDHKMLNMCLMTGLHRFRECVLSFNSSISFPSLGNTISFFSKNSPIQYDAALARIRWKLIIMYEFHRNKTKKWDSNRSETPVKQNENDVLVHPISICRKK